MAPEQPILVTHGFALRVLDDVGVDVDRHADPAVTEDLHHDAGRDAGGGEERCRTSPGVVNSDDTEAGVLRDTGERAIEVARLDGPTGAGDEDVAGLLPLLSSALAGSSLLESLPSHGSDADGGKRKRLIAPVPLGIVLVHLPGDPLPLSPEPDLPLVEVDDFPAAKAEGNVKHEGGVQRVFSGGGKEAERLVERPGGSSLVATAGGSKSVATFRPPTRGQWS